MPTTITCHVLGKEYFVTTITFKLFDKPLQGSFQDGSQLPWILIVMFCCVFFPHWNGMIYIARCVMIVQLLEWKWHCVYDSTWYLLACLCLSLCFGRHSSSPAERSIRGSIALIARPSFPALWMSHLEFSNPSEVFRFCGLGAIFWLYH